jgi:hypothetical protein
MGNTPVPKFTYPGDDPELDRLLNEARIEGERDLTSFPDMFGRRKVRAGADVDQDAATIPGSPWKSKGAGEIDKGALPSALMPNGSGGPAASTGPVVTETPAGVPSKVQTRWLALGALTIVGPVLALAFGALHQPKVTEGTQSALPVMSSAVSASAMASPPVASAAPTPKMTAPPVIEEDAGAAPAVTTDPSSTRPVVPTPGAKLGPKGPRPKSTDDPYADPSAKPRQPEPGANIW